MRYGTGDGDIFIYLTNNHLPYNEAFLPHWKASASKAAAAASASAAHLRSPTTKIFKKGAPIDKKGRKKSVCKSCEHLCSAIPLALSLSLSSSLSNTLNLSLFLTYLSFCALS